MTLRVFIGYESEYPVVSEVCAFSLTSRSSLAVDVGFLQLRDLRDRGLYWRDVDPLATTEFTYSRYLVPYLCGYDGMAFFCDNDFLWQDDVAALVAERTGDFALHCVHHDHRPPETAKMDGRPQSVYPRKNWSSLMLFNCAHPANRALTPETVSTASAAYLHRFQWLSDDQIGSLSGRWNWLEGWDPHRPDVEPGAIHFTRGGPWLESGQQYAFADRWLDEYDRWLAANNARHPTGIDQD